MLLVGTVQGRRRRVVSIAGKPDAYMISLRVDHQRGHTMVEAFSVVPNPSDLPSLGDKVSIPVEVRAFTTKAGARYSIRAAQIEGGEEF